MANIFEVPLTANNQIFAIQLKGSNVKIRLVYRDEAGWIMDIQDSSGNTLLAGAPLVTNVDLLEQYPDIGISGKLVALSDTEELEYPTKTNLGFGSHLYFVSN